ncbi:TetR/AcrR family transcriptional regulator [Pseudonocardia yunnanensis]
MQSFDPIPVTAPVRRTRSDGERSRQAILGAAMGLATIEGLEGLSIGGLAAHIGMSKSGLYAHFSSKEELQLAIITAAEDVFATQVVLPARKQPDALSRLTALCERFLSYVDQKVFPGGCFFASAGAELDTHPGPVRDALARSQSTWNDTVIEFVERAQEDGAIRPDEEASQLAFELNAFLHLANDLFVLHQNDLGIERARQAIARRLRTARS